MSTPPKPPSTLRPATEHDLPGIRRLIEEFECLCVLGKEQGQTDWMTIGQAYVRNVLSAGELSSWEACSQRFAAPASQLWVIATEGTCNIIGCVGAVQQPNDELELVRMYVDDSFRRLGYGRQLFDAFIGHARSHGAKSAFLSTPSVNAPGLAFYESLGFVKARSFGVSDPSWRRESSEGDSPLTLELSELRLKVE